MRVNFRTKGREQFSNLFRIAIGARNFFLIYAGFMKHFKFYITGGAFIFEYGHNFDLSYKFIWVNIIKSSDL
jgi:hypothetical protein